MDASRRVTGGDGRHDPQGGIKECHRRRESGVVQQVVRTDGITGFVFVADRVVMAVVMRMPVIGLRGDGVLNVVKISQRAEDRLEQHAEGNHQQQGGLQKTAAAGNAMHGHLPAYRLAM